MRVSILGFGGAEIGAETEPATAARLLGSALDAGLNVIDTAECYQDSEELIGRAVGRRRQEYYLFTKCGHAQGFADADWDSDMMEKSIDRSLRRLRTDCVDLLQLHTCNEDMLRRGEVIEVLKRARQAGKTRYIGYSGDGAAALCALTCGEFDTLQTSVNIADQQSLRLTLPVAAERGIGVIAKRPVANVAWRYDELPDNSYHQEYWRRLRALDYEFLNGGLASAVSVALRFTLAQPAVATAIVGTRNPDRWLENARLLDAGRLPDAETERIRARWREVAPPEWTGRS